MSTFEVGSWVVYPAHGVGKIEKIEHIDVGENSVDFLVIAFAKPDLILKLPVDKCQTSGLRPLVDEGTLDKAMEILSHKSKKRKSMWSKRAQEYTNKINSGSLLDLAQVLRELYKVGGDVMQSFSERQIYHQAMDRLAKEISLVKSTTEEEAIREVETILQAA